MVYLVEVSKNFEFYLCWYSNLLNRNSWKCKLISIISTLAQCYYIMCLNLKLLIYIYILIYINKCIVYSSSVSTEFAIINFLGSEICWCFCSPRQWCVGSTVHTCRTVWHVAITQNKQKYAAVNRHQIFNQHAHNGKAEGKSQR